MIIGQTGEWMTRGDNRKIIESFLRKKGRKIRLINCLPLIPAETLHSKRQEKIEKELKKMKKLSKDPDPLKIKYLSWDIHKDIEHLRLNDKQKAMIIIRKAKSSTIYPFWIERKDDYQKVKSRFDTLWNTAEEGD